MYNVCSTTTHTIARIGVSRITNWDDAFCYASPHNGGLSVAMRSLLDAYA